MFTSTSIAYILQRVNLEELINGMLNKTIETWHCIFEMFFPESHRTALRTVVGNENWMCFKLVYAFDMSDAWSKCFGC